MRIPPIEVEYNYTLSECVNILHTLRLKHLRDFKMQSYIASNPHSQDPNKFINEIDKQIKQLEKE